MPGTQWTSDEVNILRQCINQAQAAGRSNFAAAEMAQGRIGRSFVAIVGKVKELKAAGGIIPSSRLPIYNGAPEVDGDWLILCDAHIPYHHGEFISRCIEQAAAAGVTNLMLAGDAIEAQAASQWGATFADDSASGAISGDVAAQLQAIADSAPARQRAAIMDVLAQAGEGAGDMSGELRQTRDVLRLIADRFERVVYFVGNHEDRFTRLIQQALGISDFGRLLGVDGGKWTLSPYYYATITSGGQTWRVTHPINAAKGSARRLAGKYQCNVIMAHNHHYSVATDPSGRYLGVEPGACVDRTRLPYEMLRDNAADRHILGACMVIGGRVRLINEWTV